MLYEVITNDSNLLCSVWTTSSFEKRDCDKINAIVEANIILFIFLRNNFV